MWIAKTSLFVALVAAGSVDLAGCATAPSTRAERQSLRQSADATLDDMIAHEPPLRDVTRGAPAYAVFPSIAKGGALIGGAYGQGILYENGVATGYVALEQASLGAELGGQSFAELLVLRRPEDIETLKAGHYSASADAGVVVLSAGAGAHGDFDPNAAAYVQPHGGLMLDVSLSGQKLKYQSFGA